MTIEFGLAFSGYLTSKAENAEPSHRAIDKEADKTTLKTFGLTGYFDSIRSRVIGSGSELQAAGEYKFHSTPIDSRLLEEAKKDRGFERMAAHVKDRTGCKVELSTYSDPNTAIVRIYLTKLTP